MTKTEACRRVALAALLAGTIAGTTAVTHDARAGLDPYGFADEGVSPNGDGSDGAKIVPGKTGKPDSTPTLKRDSDPKRGSGQKRASDLDGVMAFFGGCPDRNNC
jgi:hypothetical protein